MAPEFFFSCSGGGGRGRTALHITNARVLHKLRNILQIIPKITLIREWIDKLYSVTTHAQYGDRWKWAKLVYENITLFPFVSIFSGG